MELFPLALLVVILIRSGFPFKRDELEVGLNFVTARLEDRNNILIRKISPVLAKHQPSTVNTERGIFDDINIGDFRSLKTVDPWVKPIDNEHVALVIPFTLLDMRFNAGNMTVGDARGRGTFQVNDNLLQVVVQVAFHGKTCLDSRIIEYKWLRLLGVQPRVSKSLQFRRTNISTFFNTGVRKQLNGHFNQPNILKKLTKKLCFCEMLFE